jgi:hypothetical protein
MSDNSDFTFDPKDYTTDYVIRDDDRNPLDECSEAYEKLKAENKRLRTALDECHTLAWYAIEEGDQDEREANLCEIERVAGAILAGDEDSSATTPEV